MGRIAMLRSALTTISLILLAGCHVPSHAQRAVFASLNGNCAIPNFCSPTNLLVNQTSAPAILQGLTGVGSKYVDPTTGNIIVRCSDYSMNGGTTGNASFRTNSDSNDSVWSSDGKAFGFCRTGGNQYVDAWDPVTNTCTPKGITAAVGPCDGVSWFHGTPMTYFYTSGAKLVKGFIDVTSPTWTGSTGGGTNIAAAVTSTNLMDISTDCTGMTYNKYTMFTLSDVSGLDANDRFVSFGARPAQDQGSTFFEWDSANGCHWLDLRTMTEGGAWGHSGAISFGSTILLPTPAAPTLGQTTGGSLTTGDTYKVCVAYVKNLVGETPCSVNTSITLSGGNTAITVTPPTSTPANTATGPTGFNFYACDDTASPGCSPVQQTNGTNASGALAQPTGVSLACTSGTCTAGANNYCVKVVANNAGGQSPYSAASCVSVAGGLGTVVTVTFNPVANATSYHAFLDYDYVNPVRNNSGSCAGTCSIAINTSPNQIGYQTQWDQTSPIATTPTITSLLATGQAPQTVNATGYNYHNGKNDTSGKWVYAGGSATNSINATQHGIGPIYYDVINGVAVPAGTGNASFSTLNIPNFDCGHRVMGNSGQVFCNDGYTGYQTRWTLDDSSANVDSSKTVINQLPGFALPYDVHFSAQMQYLNSSFPLYVGADGGPVDSHSVPTVYLGGYLWATENKPSGRIFKLCQNWESGLQGFNSQVSGNIATSGKYVAFTSDMGIGAGLTSGMVGDVSGTSSCTDNLNATGCRTDVFVCVAR